MLWFSCRFINLTLFYRGVKYNEAFIKSKELIARKSQGKKHEKTRENIPAGQIVTDKFPVLDLGVKPDFNRETWRLRVYGLVEKEIVLTYDDLLKMPASKITTDFHCVTHWSKLGVVWTGVLFNDFITLVKPLPSWKFLIQEGADGYTTNVSREDIEKENVVLAYNLEEKPIPREHGWPLRVIISQLYAWKGSKFLKGLKFVDKDEPGFWEVRGYHNHGSAFKEERYG